MRQGWRIGLLVAAMGLGAGALAQGEQQQQEEQQQQQQQQPMGGAGQQQQGEQPVGGAGQQQGRGAMAGGQLVADSKENILAQLHQINQTEIQLGQLAQQQAQSQRVKQLAQQMVQHHQGADRRLMQFAQQQGIQVPDQFRATNDVQRNLQQVTDATRQVLQNIEGRPFDQMFLASQLSQHDMAINVATQAQQRFPELAPVVSELLPQLRQHRSQVYELLGEVSPRPQARPAPTGR